MISFTSHAAAPSFDHPLEMLRACHGKILRQCDTLQKLAARLGHQGCDAPVQQAALGILRYFETAGQFHHLDEEENLFPALRALADFDKTPLPALLQRLLAEHVVMLAAWDALRPVLLQLAEGKPVKMETTVMNNFIRSHTDHIATENAELLPLATAMIDLQQLESIGQAMAERRGAKFP